MFYKRLRKTKNKRMVDDRSVPVFLNAVFFGEVFLSHMRQLFGFPVQNAVSNNSSTRRLSIKSIYSE